MPNHKNILMPSDKSFIVPERPDPLSGFDVGYRGRHRDMTLIIANRLEKHVKDETETGILWLTIGCWRSPSQVM